MKRAHPFSVHLLHISLNDIKPPIWRRVAVPSDYSLAMLHSVIQRAVGWYDDHMHQFISGKKVSERILYVMPGAGFDAGPYSRGPRTISEGSVRISDVLPAKGSKLLYEYDFGDSWGHSITVKGIVESEPTQKYPVCLDGARACPPEDSGGAWGYLEKLEDLSDPSNANYDDTYEWMGEFDPEEFDIASVNKRLGAT